MTALRADKRQGGLGRGLASLIPQRPAGGPAAPAEIPIDRIKRNPYQPRKRIDEEALEQLAESIRLHGVIQPILVTEQLDGYQLVAGERRLRAAQMAGLDRIPVVIRQLADRDQLELALVENLLRADLNPLEEALAFRQLLDEFAFTQDQLASRLGRARSTIANTLRLLDMRESVREAVADGRLTEGHARAMAGLAETDEARLLELIVARGLSVRQTEELARRLREPRAATPDTTDKPATTPDADMERVEEELRQALGTKVSLARSRRGGRIVIEYYSDEELSRLYDRLVGGTA
jgi:ParB family transcriptional regulator, chromosome partitioning protein